MAAINLKIPGDTEIDVKPDFPEYRLNKLSVDVCACSMGVVNSNTTAIMYDFMLKNLRVKHKLIRFGNHGFYCYDEQL